MWAFKYAYWKYLEYIEYIEIQKIDKQKYKDKQKIDKAGPNVLNIQIIGFKVEHLAL